MPSQQSALVLIYPGFNILDINGPIEILWNTGFTITIAACDEVTTSQENVSVKRTLALSEVKPHLADYNILIIPGSRSQNILPHLGPDGHLFKLLEVISTFAQLEPTASQQDRTILGVCMGSLLLGAAGVLDGLTATVHRLALHMLRQICADYQNQIPGAKGTRVVPESVGGTVHYVDAGLNESRVRIITSGAVTMGIDAATYYISLTLGRAAALEVAAFIGHDWREM